MAAKFSLYLAIISKIIWGQKVAFFLSEDFQIGTIFLPFSPKKKFLLVFHGQYSLSVCVWQGVGGWGVVIIKMTNR